jgi:hypothetical protein
MKKALTAFVAAGAVVTAMVSAPAPAQASHRSDHGAAIAAGVIGGLALGAIISGSSRPAYAYPAYAPAPGYVVYDSYRSPYPVACHGGYWARRPVAYDRWGHPVAWSKPRFVCPSRY